MTTSTHDPAAGHAIFVEGIRWLNIRWGATRCRNGLRRCGFTGRYENWVWHSTWRSMLVLPVIMARGLLERESLRLSRHVADLRREEPARPIHLFSCSCGAHVALRAVELLPEGIEVESVAMLAGAISPWRDLRPALGHIRNKLVSTSSKLDCLVLGAGTAIVGTGEGVHTPSAGMLGLRHPSARGEKVVQIRWRPAMVKLGWLGDHFTACASGLIARHVAPAMGISVGVPPAGLNPGTPDPGTDPGTPYSTAAVE